MAKKYPDSFDSNVPSEVVYMPLDPSEKDGFTIGQLLLSPTRTYLPLLKSLFDEYAFALDGVIHCTGGAQTKVLHFIEGLNIIKDNLLETPEVFKMIQASSNTDWKEMYKVFNMGHRLELYVDEKHSKSILDLIQSFNLEAKIIGRVEESSHKMVTLSSEYGSFVYS